MNLEERKKISALILQTAIYYNRQINKQVIAMMLDDLLDIPAGLIINAYNVYRKNPANKHFPMPAQIRSIVYPETLLSERDIANELVRKIENAVKKHGWNWESGIFSNGEFYWNGSNSRYKSFKEAVCSEVGEVGWSAICARGGWQCVRNSANQMDEGTFVAQLRDQIESLIRIKKSGVDITQLVISSENKNQIDGTTKSIIQSLLAKKIE